MADLVAHSPFEGLSPAVAGRGVTVADRDGLGLAMVLVRNGQIDALAARVKEAYDIDLPRGPRRAARGAVSFAGTGPQAWLATGEGANAFAASLKDVLRGCASVADQSDGYAVLRVGGPKVRETLAKGVPLDLHEHAFRIGDTAVTMVSHIGVTLWRLEDGADGAPLFEAAVFRSLAADFWHWLAESAAEFGMTSIEPDRI